MRNYCQKIVFQRLLILLISCSFVVQSTQKDSTNDLCHNKTFTTQSTKCTITFMNCASSNQNKFLSCKISNCQRHLGTQNCQRSLDFNLEEPSCYNQCCKSNTFNQAQCEQVNAQLKQLHQKQDNFVILALALIFVALIIFTLIFFITVLKCNKQPEISKKQEKQQSIFNWTDIKHFDAKCDICTNYGAVILTPCNHAYHQNCYIKELKDEDQIRCPKCTQKMFSTLRIVCGECREKQLKVKTSKVSILKQVIMEGMIQHGFKCQKFTKEVYTDIRLTSTGSSD